MPKGVPVATFAPSPRARGEGWGEGTRAAASLVAQRLTLGRSVGRRGDSRTLDPCFASLAGPASEPEISV
jgi:hypothetical protein